MPLVLDGRVFARQQLFMTLPKCLQEDAKHFRVYVEQDATRLFQNHSHTFVKSVYGVKGKELVGVIISWLLAQQHEPTSKDISASGPVATAQVETGSSVVSKKLLETAKQVAEMLVLMGFLAPYEEDEAQLTAIAANHYVRASELLIPVAPSATDLKTISVWGVADGAVYARNLKRKAGLLAPFTQGRDVYVVFNDKTKRAYLFESDLAREPISELRGPTLDVEFDSSHFEFSVRVSLTTGYDADTPETFNAQSEEVQQELVNAFITIGAKCKYALGYEDQSIKREIATHQDQPIENRSTGSSPYRNHSFAAPQGMPAYAPALVKHSDPAGDEYRPTPHVAP